jgi:hypothetical protein
VKKLALVVALAFAVVGNAVAAPPDGTYEVQVAPQAPCYRGVFVRLIVAQGQLSGVTVGEVGTQTIESLVLMADGSFTGSTSGFIEGARQLGATFSVSGQFTGKAVTVSLANGGKCGTRTGRGTRVGA